MQTAKMEIRSVNFTYSHLLSPSPLSPSNSPKTISFSPPTPYLLPISLRTIAPRSHTRSISRAQGFSGDRTSTTELEPSLDIKIKATVVSSELKGASIFLVGMNGTMKTSLGKLLGDALRYYYFDSDSLVEQAAGSESTAESFRERDKNVFQDSETEVLKQLSSMGRMVVCAGNGAVQSSTNLAYLRYGIVIWIDVPLDMLAIEALKTGGQSPVALAISNSDSYSEVLEKLTKQYDELKGGYEMADATVSLQKVAAQLGYEDLDSVTPEDMAVEALEEIQKLTRVKKMMEAAAKPF